MDRIPGIPKAGTGLGARPTLLGLPEAKLPEMPPSENITIMNCTMHVLPAENDFKMIQFRTPHGRAYTIPLDPSACSQLAEALATPNPE